MSYQRCTRCVMDNATDVTISFDSEGHCNYCTETLQRLPTEYFPNEQGRETLSAIIAQIKKDCASLPYDCLVGVSGGIDSSYIMYLCHQYGLRVLAVHIDDGLDNPVATENLRKLVEKTGAELVTVTPERREYADILKSLLKASVPNLAIAQDNLIIKSLQTYGKQNALRYILDGNNFAHESILERGRGVNACDKKFILGIQKQFGEVPLKTLQFVSLVDRYLKRNLNQALKHVCPLNYIPYHLETAIQTLRDFCKFEYYGGKHYESILTRFLQCYYLPVKFGIDKRKSHFSSLIVSGQMTREEALDKLSLPLYGSDELLMADKKTLAEYIGVSLDEFEGFLQLPPKEERSYPHSALNHIAPFARKFRKYIQ